MKLFLISFRIVSGAIPDGLSGIYIYNGPNPELNYSISHGYSWFDGHGMIKSIQLSNGEAFFSNQWINTTNFALMYEYKQVVFVQMGELMGFTGLVRLFYLKNLIETTFQTNDCESYTANTAFFAHNNKLYATHEASYPYEIKFTPEGKLISVGFEKFNDVLDYPFPAHAKHNPSDGYDYFCGYTPQDACANATQAKDPNNAGAFKCGRMKNGKIETYFGIQTESPVKPSLLERIAGMDKERKPYLHDYLITEHYYVLIETSVLFTISAESLKNGDYFQFHKESNFRVGILPLDATGDSQIHWFPFNRTIAVFHTLHAYEDGDEIHIFAPMADSFIFPTQYDPPIVNPYYLTEVRVNMKTNVASFQVLNDSIYIEFPRVHPQFVGQKAMQYGYSITFVSTGPPAFNGIAKIDFHSGKIVDIIRHADPNILNYEALVIPKPNEGASSDNVYLATFCFNFNTSQTFWMLYDGKTMAQEPILTLAVDGAVAPIGFHGTWLTDEFIAAMNA